MNLVFIIASALITGIVTLLLLPTNIRISNKLKLVALPDDRRVHKKVIPEAGGLSFGLTIVFMQIIGGIWFYPAGRGMMFGLAGAGLLALLLGAYDDRFEAKPFPKLIGYLALGLIMYWLGFRVDSLTNPMGGDFQLGWFAFPMTIIWYLAVINAINLIDGIDGLAAGITVIVSGVLIVVGAKDGNYPVVWLSALLLTGNLAFLKYNFHPASIFMGDTGATFIGLNLAAISTAGAAQFKGITSLTLIIPMSVLALPLLDVVLAVFRRLRLGKIFTADRAHIHHMMLGLGLSQRTIAIIVYIVTLLFGMIAIGFSFSGKRVLFLVLLGLLSLMVILAYILMRQEQKK
ncbi:MAG TPA: MraY family glycosyltransferase [Candidatus Cloacimonadota bacterium]|nr:MraY family glycosyltransferase [Candidatus Cloacimonadota bacterium]HPS38902.1 MraY family glycosyltransferase [Candidatus Cloacimonadota bacterium]